MHPAYRERRGDREIGKKERYKETERDRTQDVRVRKFNGRDASLQPNYM